MSISRGSRGARYLAEGSGVFPKWNSTAHSSHSLPPALMTDGRAFRTAGIPAGAFEPCRLVTHQPASLMEGHLSLITAFLIYGAAIRNPAKVLKT
jgi:hypothetical protein